MDGGSCRNADHWRARVEGALPPKQTRLSGKGNSSRFQTNGLKSGSYSFRFSTAESDFHTVQITAAPLFLGSRGLFKLAVVQVGVEAAFGQEFLVRALLDDIAVLQHQNQVGVLMVDSQWAMTKLVRCSVSRSMACWVMSSVRVSTEEVASSRISMGLL